MLPTGAQRQALLDALSEKGRTPENILAVAKQLNLPTAVVEGVASFYTLLREPDLEARVCIGLSCQMQGAQAKLDTLVAAGVNAHGVSCLGQCDRPVPVLDHNLDLQDPGPRGAIMPKNEELPINLAGTEDHTYAALAACKKQGPAWVLDELEASGLRGRGGAGFPTAFKWRAVAGQAVTERTVICNADEGEPATFKDREIMMRRPHLLLEGLAIAAQTIASREVIIYLRGEFRECHHILSDAIDAAPQLAPYNFRIVEGHGAYICGEETALIEALEGRRGEPRIKPPFPTEVGYLGLPTLMNNVETLANLPAILNRGGEWYAKHQTKLYSISGHVHIPGVYELPIGVTMNALIATAGGPIGTPKAFIPGGASAGFLPMSAADIPLDFENLAKADSMLGSAGVVLLNDTVDMAEASAWQAHFFAVESCGQCGPCRIGTRMVSQAINRYRDSGDNAELTPIEDIAWEMKEGSICGLGIAASAPIESAMKHFPRDFA
jgi:NADH:ubiquinone oxidoreductase subunit F (NADH-binding)